MSAPSIAATITSRPVLKPPSTRNATRPRSPLATSVWCVSTSPSSHGRPACLIELSGAAGNVADTGLRDQLDGDLGLRVGPAQIVDELRQILDRVDVVMRRRRDQGLA